MRSQPTLRALILTGNVPPSHLEVLAELERLWFLRLDVLCTDTDLASLGDCSRLGHLELGFPEPCLPTGLDAVAATPGLSLALCRVDVASWLSSPDFLPPKVRILALRNCLMPDDPGALDFPGTEVVIE